MVKKVVLPLILAVLVFSASLILGGINNNIQLSKEKALVYDAHTKGDLTSETFIDFLMIEGVEVIDILDSGAPVNIGKVTGDLCFEMKEMAANDFKYLRVHYRKKGNSGTSLLIGLLAGIFLFLLNLAALRSTPELTGMTGFLDGPIAIFSQSGIPLFSSAGMGIRSLEKLEKIALTGKSIQAQLNSLSEGVTEHFESVIFNGREHDLYVRKYHGLTYAFFKDILTENVLRKEIERNSELSTMGKFSSMVAHELRNPLGTIKASASTIKDDEKDESNIKLLDYIIKETERLSNLVEKMLNFSRPFEINKNRIDIKDFFLNLKDDILNIISDDIDLKVNINATTLFFEVDEMLLKNVIFNICENASTALTRFNSSGPYIDIKVTKNRQRILIIEIENNGPMIPEVELERIWEPFVTSDTKGVGLGLSIVKKIIDNHGGRIEVESSADRTVFRILLR